MNASMNIPTDNMYKFLAISGVLLCIACLFASIYAQDTYDKRTINILELVTESQQRTQELRKDLSSTDGSQASLEQIKGRVDIEESRVQTLEVRSQQLQVAKENATKAIQRLLYLGLLASLSGFILWYIKLQRYEDTSIRSQNKKPK